MSTRIGLGYDIHRFGESRRLVLGGLEFPGEAGLQGHSDADVLLHALTDAILGAGALGDIGSHFPPSDPANAGRDSADFVRRAQELLTEAGYRVVNVDSTVIAERPRIGPHVGDIRRSVAGLLGMDEMVVSVKASTNDRIGAIGAGEGIAALAVVLVERVSA